MRKNPTTSRSGTSRERLTLILTDMKVTQLIQGIEANVKTVKDLAEAKEYLDMTQRVLDGFMDSKVYKRDDTSLIIHITAGDDEFLSFTWLVTE